MSLREWWEAVKELFEKPQEQAEPQKRFVPPHASQPEGKPQPEWPPKEQRK